MVLIDITRGISSFVEICSADCSCMLHVLKVYPDAERFGTCSVGEISATKDRGASEINHYRLRFLSIESNNRDVPTAVTYGASM